MVPTSGIQFILVPALLLIITVIVSNVSTSTGVHLTHNSIVIPLGLPKTRFVKVIEQPPTIKLPRLTTIGHTVTNSVSRLLTRFTPAVPDHHNHESKSFTRIPGQVAKFIGNNVRYAIHSTGIRYGWS